MFATMFHAAMAVKTYIVTFRWQKDRRPSKFIVVADSMREAIDKSRVFCPFQSWFLRCVPPPILPEGLFSNRRQSRDER
jgi:hypothetical protein